MIIYQFFKINATKNYFNSNGHSEHTKSGCFILQICEPSKGFEIYWNAKPFLFGTSVKKNAGDIS